MTSSLYADPERVQTLKVSTRSFLRVSCQLVDGWISISPWVSKGILGLGGGGCVDKSVFFIIVTKKRYGVEFIWTIFVARLDLSRELLPRTGNNGFLVSFIYSN